MKHWLTAAEIAEAGLPGLPVTREAVARLAQDKGWRDHPHFARERQGRGGGFEYFLELLPLEARIAWATRHGGVIAEAAEDAVAAAPDLSVAVPPAAALARDARIHVMGVIDAIARESGFTRLQATTWYVPRYNIGKEAVPAWVREALPRISERSIRRWFAAAGRDGVDCLAVDRGASRRACGLLDTAMEGRIKLRALALIANNHHLSADHVRETLIDTFGAVIEGQPFPHIRTLQSALKRWRRVHAQELLALTNPDAFKSRNRVSGSRAHLVSRLNEMWEIDASPADVLTTEGRRALYVCIDVWSRRLIILVTKTPRAEAVALLMRKAILAWGVPELVKTDNGSDFTARATKRLFAALGIATETAAPFSPEQKGVVERAIGTVQRDFATPLPGFIGHSVADRKVIEARKAFAQRLGQDDARAFCVELTEADLAARADAWANDRYAHRAHGGLDGQTPFARAAAYTGTIKRISDEAALSVLLAPLAEGDGTRIVGKQGIRLDGSYYIAPTLMPGTRVMVRLDPADLGRVWCFDPETDAYLSTAICPELAGVDRAAAVAEARAMQARMIADAIAPIRKDAGKLKPAHAADAIARQAALRAGKLIEMPRRAESHSTPALEAAAEMLEGRKGPPRETRQSEAARGLQAEIEADLAARAEAATRSSAPVRRLRATETPSQRFRRARAIEAELEAGAQPAADDLIWLGGYRQSPEYRAQATIAADFGEAAL
jgi:transposase InsO family protein